MSEHGERRGHRRTEGPLGGRRRAARFARPLAGASLAVALVGIGAGTGAAGAVAAHGAAAGPAARGLQAVSPAPALPQGARVTGAVPATAAVTGAVALKLPDAQAVTNFIDATSDPRSPLYHHYLAAGQFPARFGPSEATVEAVEHVLAGAGLKVTGVSANRLLVSFSGDAAAVESAFHTGLEQVRLADGSRGQATTSAATLPATIAPDVQAVVGLDQLVHETDGLERPTAEHHGVTPAAPTPHATGAGPVACPDALAQQVNGALTDQQVADSYGLAPLYGADDTAAGQTVDIYELEPFDMSDVSGFDDCYFGADHTDQITVIPVDGGPGTGPGSGEAALDVEDVSAIAPGAAIHVFSGPNMDDPFGPLDTWNAIAVADDAGQISSSWGECETLLQQGAPGVQQVENEIFEQTAAQGQTVFSAAGDDGSDDCANHGSTPVATDLSLDDPASQPYVTSVGGTTILDATEPPAETVWNNGNNGGAGGGGISESWAMPPWQTSVAVPQTSADEACSNDPDGTADDFHLQGFATTLTAGTECRETPDVSALADPQTGITIEYGGSWTQIGGTSSSTPLWAAMLAEIAGTSGCSALSGGRVGFADPMLYQIASSSTSDYADAFSDITSGNNDNLEVGGALDWQAGTGYDLASGLGTPRLTDASGSPGLASQLCTVATGSEATAPPSVASLTPDSGASAGGGTAVIAGSNFGSTTGAVYFGDVPAQVTAWTPVAITVDVPPYSAPEGTPAGNAGSADVTVVTAGAAPESSSPGTTSTYHYTATSPAGGPVVDYVSSSTGPTGGGGTVTIVGAGLTGATAVHFGDVAASGLTVIDDNELQVTVPASDGTCAVSDSQGMCAVAVTVTTPAGTSATTPAIEPAETGPIVAQPNGAVVPPAGCDCEIVPAPEEYDYAPTPTITSVTPTYASENGGSVLTITGTGFNLLDTEWVNVGPAGQNFSQDFSIVGIDPTSIDVSVFGSEATTEPAPSDISVQTGGGLSDAGTFDYAGTPVLTSISKHVAAQADPGTMTITGDGLLDVDSVVFQGVAPLSFLTSTAPPSSITIGGDNSITVQIPQFFTFPTDVLVCSVTGCSSPDPAIDSFVEAYPGRPVVSSSSPSSGPAQGGAIVTIQGVLDSELTSVDFGTAPATILEEPELTASGPIVVAAPPGTAGSKVDITISTIGGTLTSPPAPTSATTPAATFTYRPSAPAAPLSATARAGAGVVTVGWRPPADDGGEPITGYLVTGHAPHESPVSTSVQAGVRSVEIPDLATGVPWTFDVAAVNRLGTGFSVSSNPATLTVGHPAQGYWLATATGSVYGVAGAPSRGGTSTSAADPVTGVAGTPDGAGYWLVTAHGTVTARGDASFFGDLATARTTATDIVSIVATTNGDGYWLLGADGQVYAFGDAGFHGDLLHVPGGKPVHVSDIVGMEAAPAGTGYILIGADGGVFAFGAVHYYGSLPGIGVKVDDIRGILAAPSGTGYVLVGADGGAFVFGHGAPYQGSLPGRGVHVSDIVGLALTPDGLGYWMAGSNGAVYSFGDAGTYTIPSGVASHLPVAAIAGT